MIDHDKRFLTRDEMAKRLRVSVRHLDNLRKRGRLPFVPIGDRVFFDPEDVYAALKRQAPSTTAA